ncbi:uncharacterized protein LOC144032878 [Festucalex cinctus]
MSWNLPDLALKKTREKGNAAMCSGKKAPTSRFQPGVFTGPTKCHVHTLGDKLLPYRRNEDCRLRLPPINQNTNSYELSTNLNIQNLKRQNGDLQLQLIVFKTQSKVMKNVLHRHSVAVRDYHRLEGSLAQIQNQHVNEVKTVRKLLGKTRSSCDMLAKKLQESEKELLYSKEKILQLESQIFHNPDMLEKEELSRRLDEATVELKEKNKRIWELVKNNKLLESTLDRHIAAEEKKMSKTNEVYYCLQARVYELTKEIQERKKKLKQFNLPVLRFEHLANKKETFNKMVQTDDIESTLSAEESSVKLDSFESDELQKWLTPTSTDNVPGGAAVKYLKGNKEHAQNLTDFQEISDHQMAGDCSERNEVTDASQQSVEEEQDEDSLPSQNLLPSQKCPDSCSLTQTIIKTPPQQIGRTRTPVRRKYVYSPVTTNLHLGKPTYSRLELKSLERQTLKQSPRKSVLSAEEEDDDDDDDDDDDTPYDYQTLPPDRDIFTSLSGTQLWR